MRSMTREQAFDYRVMQFLAGQDPMQCHQIAAGMAESVFDVRGALVRLMKSQDVREIRGRGPIYYERTHGGYSPGPEAA